jgi:hypothetical protein
MKIPDMIAVLEAAERGEQIEYEVKPDLWMTTVPEWDFSAFNYRIAPKKQELSLVDQLRRYGGPLMEAAADQIEELEKSEPIIAFTTDELLDELRRRCE